MSSHFPSRDELSAMNLEHLRALHVEDMEDEKLLQEIINSKVIKRPLEQKVYNLDAQEADIRTPEQEAEWQKVINERTAKLREQAFGKEAVLNEQIEEIEEKQEEIKDEIKDDGVKCELCGTKGFRHKKGCPTLIKE